MNKITACLLFLSIGCSAFAQVKSLSDEFDSNTLGEWKRFYSEEGWPDMMETIEVKDGNLIMEPYTSGWYADYHAPFIFKEVSGDFTVITKIKVAGRNTENPKAMWSLAGLMVRVPRDITRDTWKPDGENWLFITTGFAHDTTQSVFETKTTINSRSSLKLTPNKTGWVGLKIQRKGATFTLSYKYEKADEGWVKLDEFRRPDFPDTLQVGLNAYTDYFSAGEELMKDVFKYNTTVVKYGEPDLRVFVDYIRFE